MTAENPNWRNLGCDPAAIGIEDRRSDNIETLRRER
jgi:hypothetical protein